MLRPTSSAVLRLGGDSRNAALVASAIIALVGLLAGAVRVLPWLLAPAVPWRVAEPFARGLVAVSFEAALLVGWPIGWALACFRFVEGGEARVLQTLGQPPHETVARLMPRGAPLASGARGRGARLRRRRERPRPRRDRSRRAGPRRLRGGARRR